MENLSCAIVRDLLPLRADGAASPETCAAVDAHLDSCPDCRREYDAMTAALPAPPPESAAPLRAIRGKILRRRRLAVLLSVFLTAAVLLLAVHARYGPVIFQRGNPLPYVAAIRQLDADTPFVRVDVPGEIYLSRRGPCPELMDHIEETYQVVFREQGGAAYLFADGERRVCLTSEIYFARYNVWVVS